VVHGEHLRSAPLDHDVVEGEERALRAAGRAGDRCRVRSLWSEQAHTEYGRTQGSMGIRSAGTA
jgi:hypothetical protein